MGSPQDSGPGRLAELESLHAATRRLLDADDRSEIASVTVDAAVDILDFPFSVVWYPASTEMRHEPGGGCGRLTRPTRPAA